MKPSTKDKAEGTMHSAKGAIKEKIGHTMNKSDMEAAGLTEKEAGKAQKDTGSSERASGR